MPLRYPDRTPEAYRFPLTIRHLLDAAMLHAADREIVYRDSLRMTYRDLRGRIGRLASALAALGVEQGQTVAVMDWDSHRYLEAYFAIPMMGAVIQTVNVRLPPAQIAYTLDHAHAEVILCHHEFLPLLDAVLSSLPGVRTVVVIADGAEPAARDYASGEYEALLADASPDFDFVDFDEEAMATTFYTTGTTGNPKGVCFTHRQIVLQTLAANAPFGDTARPGFGADGVYMPLTPMFHVHAWGMPYVATMIGAKQVYPGRYEPSLIVRLFQEERVTFSHCVPTILQMVLAAADEARADLAGWTMTIGGSAMTRALYEEGTRRGMILSSGYGMSETAPLIAIARPPIGGDEQDEAEIADALTASGIAAPLVSMRIVDGDGRELSRDGRSRGELVLRAPWLTPCYTGDEAASRRLWEGGWLHTGDVATIDPDGYLVIRDRLKDVIKSGGEWICSLTLEDIVAGVPGVLEVAVVGVPDARWGERPIALVVPAPGAALDPAAVMAPILAAIEAGALTRYARFDRVEIVDALPRTSVGKIDKKLLRARAAATEVGTEVAA